MDIVSLDYQALADSIVAWGQELGLQQLGVSDIDLDVAEQRLEQWLQLGRHGDMAFMARHGLKRTRPALLVPGTVRVISVRWNYLTRSIPELLAVLANPTRGYIACYALGRDYHRLLRRRLQLLAQRISTITGEFTYRVYVDSAPVMEKPLAVKAGLGWIGKHTNLLNKQAGSWFFLGEIYTDLPLPISEPATNHCGSCQACIRACPTQAIVAPYQLDATRCLAYLSVEYHGSIPEPLRPLLGNRVFGCDDCQLVCPWNRFAKLTNMGDMGENPTTPFIDLQWRRELQRDSLLEFFAWSEAEFLQRTAGTAIYRLGWLRWLRNIAVALGNSPRNPEVLAALQQRTNIPSPMVQEHVYWAIARQLGSYKKFLNPDSPDYKD